MKGWATAKIGFLCDAGGGKVKTGPFGSQLHEFDYSETGIPVVMPQDILDGRIDETHIARVSETHIERLKKQWGRVLYSYIGTTAEQMRLGCMTSRETITASCGKNKVVGSFFRRSPSPTIYPPR